MSRILICLAAAAAIAGSFGPALSQERLNDATLINTLNVLDDSKKIDVAALRKKAVDSVAMNRGPDRSLREPLLTIAPSL